MTIDTIHFAHANGFPARTYSKLFRFLEDDFEIGYIDQHGHDPRFPVTDNWNFLQNELQTAIEERYRKPVIGVGHSLGGILHLLVAAEHPHLYKSVVLLDAPVISRSSSFGIKILKKLKLLEKHSPARATKMRRRTWKDEEEAFRHFAAKPKYSAFDPEVLRDYVKHGTEESEKGVRLIFKPGIEASIYETLPVDLPRLRGKLSIPLSYIGGINSREARLANLRFMKKHIPANYYFLEGSHLFPFESPEKTAETIKTAITAMNRK
ncbi:MAG: alpha/beta hydrolase [Pyrinomonadaceae bacterium]|nr:alpha/beta hydrolase [Pyrinomonadaceae bacterium]